MKKICDLAIVIPAYKGDFLAETLESVFAQTNTDYHVYVFNDASPDQRIETIVRSFGLRPNLTYMRFDTNMGQESLPGQWNRCIRHTGNERWIWLFSDDDVMDPDCVGNFRETTHTDPENQLFRFNTVKFRDETLLARSNLSEHIVLADWLYGKLNYRFESYVVEYIFERSLYDRIGGFPDFPLGWCADDWFWIQAMQQTNLITIAESLVYWRYSDLNISGAANDPQTAFRKMTACLQFQNEMVTNGIFRFYPETKPLFRNWIEIQWSHLGSRLSVEDKMPFVRLLNKWDTR